jgi:hypothetical protein
MVALLLLLVVVAAPAPTVETPLSEALLEKRIIHLLLKAYVLYGMQSFLRS